ncbi:hypothetical protein EYF80_031496 [Liparis tanakae]|uniref:Uncharacterized protein n=1 Tax=Liparis tanakae TaxID=230148 RepID=A0A4Z2GXK1_9TELE|nr:hypothetical protein EYF80_031496 [Liparis tanakae]
MQKRSNPPRSHAATPIRQRPKRQRLQRRLHFGRERGERREERGERREELRRERGRLSLYKVKRNRETWGYAASLNKERRKKLENRHEALRMDTEGMRGRREDEEVDFHQAAKDVRSRSHRNTHLRPASW